MKKIIFLLAITLGVTSSFSVAHATYEDIPQDSPYKEAVDYLELIGAADNSSFFYPEKTLTKAAFYKILFKTFQEETSGNRNPFNDVPSNAWFTPYAKWAASNQLETGALFEPSSGFSKIQALQKLMQAYGITGGIVPQVSRSKLFVDVTSAHPYYSTIFRLVEEGILSADPETKLDPFSILTRGHFAQLVFDFEEWHHHQLEIAQSDFYKSDIFANIWNQILYNFYLPSGLEIDPDALFQAAVNGMLNSLEDPFTMYFTPTQSNEFHSAVDGSFEGIGAYLGENEDGQFIFTGFVPDSPAEESGLEVGDLILSIDDIAVEGMSLENIIERIQGASGTTVRITIERDGKSLSYKITRKAIQIKLVTSELRPHKVWYLDIDSFGGSTVSEFLEGITNLEKSAPHPKAIILDLRGNGGGYISSAAQIGGQFVPYLTTLVQLDYGADEDLQSIVNADKGPYHGIPLYILVNEYTASASEILALLLREEDDAIIVGTQTFGKGSAQTLTDYWDGSELKLTIAHWVSGQGTSIHGVGVTPDIVVAENEEEMVDAVLKAAEQAIDRL